LQSHDQNLYVNLIKLLQQKDSNEAKAAQLLITLLRDRDIHSDVVTSPVRRKSSVTFEDEVSELGGVRKPEEVPREVPQFRNI